MIRWGRRRCFPVEDVRSQIWYNFWNSFMKNLLIHPFGLLLLGFVKSFLPTPLLPSDPNFIITIPKGNRRVMSDSSYVVFHLLFDSFDCWKISKYWIHCTSKHQIMPYHNTSSIHLHVKLVMLIMTTSPNSDHVISGKQSLLSNLDIFFL